MQVAESVAGRIKQLYELYEDKTDVVSAKSDVSERKREFARITERISKWRILEEKRLLCERKQKFAKNAKKAAGSAEKTKVEQQQQQQRKEPKKAKPRTGGAIGDSPVQSTDSRGSGSESPMNGGHVASYSERTFR